ncbi:MAG: hypothetical protein K2H53_04065, partial [Clostridia bacterium]|nr:hypothetical protein [Clostridia bacterium]
MKILEFKGKMSLKNKILIILASVVMILFVVITPIYMLSSGAREWINVYILRKEITEDDIATIEIEVDKTQHIYAYDRFISILYTGKLSVYNSYASKEAELDVAISNPIYDTNHNYLVIAENNGQKIYLISDTRVLWENKVEGNITKINVSRNGNVSVIITGTSHKSIIVTFDKNGKELFKTYLASSIAVDTDISIDGKYLAIAEINTSGTLIESKVRVIDMEKAISGEGENSVIFRYNADDNKMITNIKYQERGQLVCMYTDSIHMIYNDKDTSLLEFASNTKIADINLKSSFVRAEETSAGLFNAKTDIIIKSILNG